MSLRECEFKGYYSGGDDILQEFLIPALRCSKQYDRITGDFSSSAVALLAPGLQQLINRDGEIRLMTGLELQPKDIKAIERGERGEVIQEQLSWQSVVSGEPDIVREALAWLIDEGYLKLRVGAVIDGQGQVRSTDYGQWHQKLALFTHEEGGTVSVSGSPNESFKALMRNRESIELNRSWSENAWEREKVQRQRAEFDRLWRNEDPDAMVMSLPDGVQAELVREKPQAEPDWGSVSAQVYGIGGEEDSNGLPDPYDHQQVVIERLQAGDGQLLMNHATGTGKTWTSLFALRELSELGDAVVILAPTTDLVKQWAGEENLQQFFPEDTIVQCYGGADDWRRDLYNALMNAENRTMVVSTMHPGTMSDVLDQIAQHTRTGERHVIADEVHNIGTPRRAEVLSEFDAGGLRIGLSATLDRGDAGDTRIRSYFGTEVDEIPIGEAIHEHEVLSRYSYSIHKVVLTPDERDYYHELSEEITQLYHRYKSSDDQPISEVADQHGDLREAIMDRAAVVKECAAKTEITRELLDETGSRTLVFCNTKEHSRLVKTELDEVSKRSIGFFHGGLSDGARDRLLGALDKGLIDTMVSIDCLTEGIDVPQCDSAILITNSTSERESVQRRGRVLRRSGDEEPAEIHDFITLPAPRKELEAAEELAPADAKLVRKELRRAERMNEAAENDSRNAISIISLRRLIRKREPDVNTQY